jgi:very-short-patch-repair endonuclease
VGHWFSEAWLPDVLTRVVAEFDRACDRWRGMYRAAETQRDTAHAIIGDATAAADVRAQARRLRAEAEAQLELLTDSRDVRQSDFYSYRYLASEGFLPGYSFPRLPLSAYIPGRRNARGEEEYVSRPRFLAISEFGPKAIVYHEGARYIINRVILPARAIGQDGQDVLTTEARQCAHCGYLHPIAGPGGVDVCQLCGRPLEGRIRDLFRLENVATRRRDRISSDEEERFRLGYELRTALRFADANGEQVKQVAAVMLGPDRLATLTYGHAATLWRINFGWTRRTNPAVQGFPLDIQNGYWKSDQDLEDDDDAADPVGQAIRRVIPYVEDRRNALLVEVHDTVAVEDVASLQAAFKNAIQARFQLEESELAAEPLPNADARRSILFYESAEGGAGVLRRFVEDPAALGTVARDALEICHFDPGTGADQRRAPGASEDCEAACYDCLMSYSNQRDHRLLDRQRIKPVLERLAKATVRVSPKGMDREQLLARLRNQCGSDLERRWLSEVDRHQLRLPSGAQVLIERCATRPDFLYGDSQTAVFIDGPHHDEPGQQALDRRQEDALLDAGYAVVRFRHDEPWEPVFDRHRSVFGVRA